MGRLAMAEHALFVPVRAFVALRLRTLPSAGMRRGFCNKAFLCRALLPFWRKGVGRVKCVGDPPQVAEDYALFGNDHTLNSLALFKDVTEDGSLVKTSEFNVTPLSPAWNILKQLLQLKINNGDGTKTNSTDLLYMNTYEQLRARRK